MEFSKKMLLLHSAITVCLAIAAVIGTFTGYDVTALTVLDAASFVVDGTWGGFYLWKSKNENRSKYTQKFVKKMADKYGIDAALRAAEIVLKD